MEASVTEWKKQWAGSQKTSVLILPLASLIGRRLGKTPPGTL